MGIFSPPQQQAALPPMAPPPVAPIPVPDPIPTPVDPSVKQARDAAKKRAAALQGYASTIATSGQGDLTPVSTTANGGKTMLGA